MVDSFHGNKNIVRLTDILSPGGIDVCLSDTFSEARAHFTRCLGAHDWNLMKILFALFMILIIQ